MRKIAGAGEREERWATRGKFLGKRGDSKVVEVGGREERKSGLQLRRIGGGEG